MNLSCEALSADLSGPDGWEFGDVPYGLEPLVLPLPGTPDDEFGWPAPDPAPRHDLAALCPALAAHGPSGRPPVPPRPAGGGTGPGPRLYWFRWITGHQVSFVLWRLLAREMAAASLGEAGRRAAALTAMTAYTRGYCAMLLYTSSCTREVYEGLIRPTMFLQHPGFSGSWAPDYRPVRHLFRRRQLPARGGWPDGPGAAELRRAVATYQMTHAGVAARLVPGGRSLLQAAPAADTRRPELLGTVYDNYFLTVRAPASAEEVVLQLLRRLEAVTLDLAVNGLYPDGAGDRPPELCGDDVLACEHDMFGVLLGAARHAAGLAATDVGVAPQSV